MIKRTLYFGNPAYLLHKDNCLIINYYSDKQLKSDSDRNYCINSTNDKYTARKEKLSGIPIEDIGVLILDHYGVVVSQYLLFKLLENNTAVIICNDKHLPTGLLLNLDGNSVQAEKFAHQIKASVPLKKNLWMQTVTAKILNQATLLKKRRKNNENLLNWASKVNSGDTKNLEARASVYYWKNLFPPEMEFQRDSEGDPPNNLLNYGYAILRATIARALVASGLLPTLGIHHRNKYNAYCLADDIMEPYRPFVDKIVCDIMENDDDYYSLSKKIKEKLLNIPAEEITIDGKKSPLMVGIQRTTSSLARCFEGTTRKILYPEIK